MKPVPAIPSLPNTLELGHYTGQLTGMRWNWRRPSDTLAHFLSQSMVIFFICCSSSCFGLYLQGALKTQCHTQIRQPHQKDQKAHKNANTREPCWSNSQQWDVRPSSLRGNLNHWWPPKITKVSTVRGWLDLIPIWETFPSTNAKFRGGSALAKSPGWKMCHRTAHATCDRFTNWYQWKDNTGLGHLRVQYGSMVNIYVFWLFNNIPRT